MKECDIFRGGVKTYSDPPTYFQGVKTHHPQDLRPWFPQPLTENVGPSKFSGENSETENDGLRCWHTKCELVTCIVDDNNAIR